MPVPVYEMNGKPPVRSIVAAGVKAMPKPGYQLLFGGITYLVLGYALYGAALYVGHAPQWAAGFMNEMKMLFPSATVAMRVANRLQSNPFPAQVVIIYCALATPFLTVWFVHTILGNVVSRNRWVAVCSSLRFGPFTLVVCGSLSILLMLIFPAILFDCIHRSRDWQVILLFSSSPGSAFLLLLSGFIPAVTAPMATCLLYSALSRHTG